MYVAQRAQSDDCESTTVEPWYASRSMADLCFISDRRITFYIVYFFFFQAEDGIRDLTVTGVQTCALPILRADARIHRGGRRRHQQLRRRAGARRGRGDQRPHQERHQQRTWFGFRNLHRKPDRKSTRLNSSHSQISYAVFCLKKKKNITTTH